MTDVIDPRPAEAGAEPLGWYVTDPDGNIIAAGPITHAQAAFLVGETTDSEGAQE